MARWTTGPSAASRCWSARAGVAGSARRRAASAARPASRRGNLGDPGFDEADGLIGRELRALAVPAIAVFQAAGLETPIPDHQPMRNAEELCVGEFDARTGIAVVVEHLDALGGELVVEAIGNFSHPRGLLQIERDEHDLEGCQRLRPDDAALIVILLDGGGHDARHTDAIAPHEQRHFSARLIEHGCLEGLAVLAPELEDVSHLDATGDLEATAAARARIPRAHVAKVGGSDVGDVPLPVDSR